MQIFKSSILGSNIKIFRIWIFSLYSLLRNCLQVANKEFKFGSIASVAVSDGATVVVNEDLTMYVLHEYKWREVVVNKMVSKYVPISDVEKLPNVAE